MEKLKGGNVLIDLTNITLAIGTETSITDAEVLEHFKELYPLVRNGSPKNLIFVKVSDASEEIIVPCEHVIDGSNLEIRGKIYADANTSYGLVIDVAYSVGDYDAISVTSCKYTYSGDLVLDGEILDANGNSAIDVGTSDVTISKNVNIGNTGSTKDLYVSGDLSVDDINASGNIIGKSIIQNELSIPYTAVSPSATTIEYTYVGHVQNGNKITFVVAGEATRTGTQGGFTDIGYFTLPTAIADKIIPAYSQVVDIRPLVFFVNASNIVESKYTLVKNQYNAMFVRPNFESLTANTKYYFRIEVTFLLSDSIVSE